MNAAERGNPGRITESNGEAWTTQPAPLDLETLRTQAEETYTHAETLRETDPAAAARFHSVAALLYHLLDGSYTLSVSIPVANRGRY